MGGLDLSRRPTTAATYSVKFINGAPTHVDVTGAVHLGDANLAVVVPTGTVIAPADRFTIISNDGTDPVTGTFAGLPENAVVQTVGNFRLRITYRGGDGNDVVVTKIATPLTAVGAGAGGLPIVNVYDRDGGLMRSFLAYDPSFRGGVRVAVADVTGDGIWDVITAPGPGGGPHIKVFDGVTGALVRQWMAYDPAFRGGVFVAAAPIDLNDDLAEIVTGAGAGGGPHVQVFDGKTGAVVTSFMAYDPAFTGGVNVAAIRKYTFVDVDPRLPSSTHPGRIVTGTGPGGGPHVRIFDGTNGRLEVEFFAYDLNFRGGVTVAASFDTSNHGYLVTAPGPGAPPEVRVYDGSSTAFPAKSFLAYGADFRGGVTLRVIEADRPAILTGAGPGGGPHVRQWRFPSNNVTDFTLERDFFAFDPRFTGGIFVG